MKKKRTLLFTMIAVASLGLTSCSIQDVKSWLKNNLYTPATDFIDGLSGKTNEEQGENNQKEDQKEQQEEQKQEEQETEHTHTWVYQHDETKHWQVCSECDETKEKENHSGGAADCLHKAVCSVCGAEYGELGVHSFGNLISQVNATCEQPGVAAHYQCSVCGKYFTEDKVETTLEALAIDALGHSFGSLIPASAPDCENDGLAEHYHCDECDKYFNSEKQETTLEALKLEKLGHEFGELIAKVDPDCVNSGLEAHYECSRCHKLFDLNKVEKSLEELTIPAKGHSGVLQVAHDATCTEPGNSAYYVCSDCGKFFSDEQCQHEIELDSWIISAKGHTGILHGANAPTCENDGNSAYYECSDCGKFFSDAQCENEIELNSWVIPATGHTGVLHGANAASCDQAGNSAYYVCSECGKFFSDEQCENEIAENSWVIPAKGHSGVLHAANAATCTEPGNSAYYVCSDCGKFFSDEQCEHEIAENSWVISAKGHTGVLHGANAPLCEQSGNSAYYECSDCGKFFSDEQCEHEIAENSWIIPATGHSGVLHAANSATCEQSGNSAYYECSACGKFFSDEQCEHEIAENSWIIAATGHNYGSLVPELMPDGVNEGHSAYYHCSDCGKYFDENHVESSLANLTYDASGDLLTLAKSVQGSAFNANASFDMRCEAQTGYGLHFHANEEYNNWPTVKIELRESHDLSNASVAVVGKFTTTKPRLAFKFYDSSNELVSYGWQTAIDFLGTTSYTDLMDWTQKTVTNASMVAALQSGKDLSDVKFIEIGVDFNANHGIVQDAYVDELHIIDNVYAANTSSVANLEMGTYSAGQWRGYGSTPTIVYDTYGANSNSSLKVTFKDTTATLPGRVYASFDLAQTSGIGTSNTIDVKNSTLSFDIKLSQEFYDANNSQFTFKHEDSSWKGVEKWYSYPGYSTGNPNTWLHVSIDLSAKYGSETRNADTYAITFGFFGMTAETAQTAWVIIDNISITPNA